jgi:hypothetical protein
VFGISGGETLVLILLLLIFVGPGTLPDLAQAMRERFWTDEPRATGGRRSWSRTEWLLVTAILALGSLGVALAAR